MENDIRIAVRDAYGDIAKTNTGCCGSEGSSCCGGNSQQKQSEKIGYSMADLASIPGEADLGLGCGNPTAIASIEDGETVLDLGSGGGIDCFLASKKVGPGGRVIGVDMTAAMIERSRNAALDGGYGNVEFRLGEIEHLPVADMSVDVLISNCVINLSPDKPQVFKEAYRVLSKGGRMMISDIVVEEALPEKLRGNLELYAGCVAGAMIKEQYLQSIRDAGFTKVEVTGERSAAGMISPDDPTVKAFIAEADVDPAEAQRLAAGIKSVEVLAYK